jgi:hypothetical protein
MSFKKDFKPFTESYWTLIKNNDDDAMSNEWRKCLSFIKDIESCTWKDEYLTALINANSIKEESTLRLNDKETT